MRVLVGNNYTKKRNHFAAKTYPTLCYGDLDAELDFPSCEISFCSPAGRLHHFAIPPPLAHPPPPPICCTRMQSLFPLRELLLHLQHLASRASCYYRRLRSRAREDGAPRRATSLLPH